MAHYTDLGQEAVHAAMLHYLDPELYDVAAAAGEKLKGGLANSNFRVEVPLVSGGSEYFLLKVCDEKTIEELEVQCSVLLSARESGVRLACCLPLLATSPSAAASSFVLQADLQGEGRTLRCMLFEFLSGVAGVNEAGSPAQAASVGRELAKLHSVPAADGVLATAQAAGRPAKLPEFPMGVAAIRPFLDEECPQQLLSHPFVTHLAEGLDLFAALEAEYPDLPKGLTHGDLFLDNIMFGSDGHVVGLLDFEEACEAALLLDVAMTLCGCCYTPAEDLPNSALSSAFLRAYQEVRRLSASELAALPGYLRYAQDVIAFWRFRQFNVRHPGHKLAEFYVGPWGRAKALTRASVPLLHQE